MRYTLLLSFLFLIVSCNQTEKEYTTWNNYGGSKENIHYSSLTEIDTNNVSQLQPAWIFNTGDADTVKNSQIQCNPIIVDSIMYLTSPTLKLFALHAGQEKKYGSSTLIQLMSLNFVLNNSRGVTYWTDGKNDKRIFYVASSYLHCIDATNGQLVRSFGDSGLVDLHNDLGREVADLFVTATSPGIIYKDLYILGSRVDEGAAAAPGHIRAFDVRTGKLRWIFHTIRNPVKLVMKHGKIRKHINILAALIAGAVLPLMKKEEFYLHQLVLLLMIFMVVKEKGKFICQLFTCIRCRNRKTQMAFSIYTS